MDDCLAFVIPGDGSVLPQILPHADFLLDFNGRMFQAYIPVIRVIADRGLSIHFHFDVITVGKDHKRGHQPVALIITPGKFRSGLHHDFLFRVLLAAQHIGSVFWNAEHVHDAVVTDLIA